jgi:predicted PurR-regulated permease PerM
MQKVVGLNPVISIAVLLIGLEIGGIPGAILSIPVTTAISVFLGDVFDDKVAMAEEKPAE